MRLFLTICLLAAQSVWANLPPSIANQTFAVDENKPTGTLVGTVLATDPDNNPLKYSIIRGNESEGFLLDSTNGKLTINFAHVIDYERYQKFELRVKVSDGWAADSATITININNLNDTKPYLADTTLYINENTAKNTSIHKIFAIDPDGWPLTYRMLSPLPNLDNDADLTISLDSVTGVIKVLDENEFDYEKFKSFSVLFEVWDGAQRDTAKYFIQLINLNDNKPVIQGDTIVIYENRPAGFLLHNVNAWDADFPLDTLYYTLLQNPDPNINYVKAFKINPLTAKLTVLDSADFDREISPTLSVKVIVSDSTYTDTADIHVILLDINDSKPVVHSDTFLIDEHLDSAAFVGKIRVSDPDSASSFTYQIIDGNRSNAFFIDSLGNLRVLTSKAVDYEQTINFSLTVKVSDGVFESQNQIRINLRNINDNPPVVGDRLFLIPENITSGVLVGSVSATDSDGDTLSFRIVGGNYENAFRIGLASQINNIQIFSDQSQAIDHEKYTIFPLSIEVSDGELTDTATVSIRLINLNDEPIFISDTTFTVDENDPFLNIGTLAFVDRDELDEAQFSFVDPAYHDSLTIGGFGQIRAKNYQVINYEYRSRFSFLVQVFDGFFYDTARVTVNILDSNDPPRDIILSDTVIKNTTPKGTRVAWLSALDDDRSDSHTFRIISDTATDDRFFVLKGKELILDHKAEYNIKNSYRFVLEVKDASGASFRKTVRMTVSPINNLETNFLGVIAYPNPTERYMRISLFDPELGQGSWAILSPEGKIIQQSDFQKTNEYWELDLELVDLPSGLYLLRVTLQNRSILLKISKY